MILMADGTRFKQQEELLQHQVENHEENINDIKERIDQLADMMMTLISNQINGASREPHNEQEFELYDA